jgi:hypothetical protein
MFDTVSNPDCSIFEIYAVRLPSARRDLQREQVTNFVETAAPHVHVSGNHRKRCDVVPRGEVSETNRSLSQPSRWIEDQYVNAVGDWTIARHPVSDGIGLRVSPGPDKTLPKESYATYVLVVAQHTWQRTGQTGG